MIQYLSSATKIYGRCRKCRSNLLYLKNEDSYKLQRYNFHHIHHLTKIINQSQDISNFLNLYLPKEIS
jgi:hypothetical protein